MRKWIKTTGGYLLASEKISLLYYSQPAQECKHPRLGWLPVWLEARGHGGQKTVEMDNLSGSWKMLLSRLAISKSQDEPPRV